LNCAAPPAILDAGKAAAATAGAAARDLGTAARGCRKRYGVILQITHMPSMMLTARLSMSVFCIVGLPLRGWCKRVN
jgi:hypothetical protein